MTRNSVEKFVDIVGEVLAFLTLALMLLLFINGSFNFIPGNVTKVLAYIREIAIIAVVGLSAMELAIKGRFVLMVIFLVLLTGVIIFIWFPGAVPF
ncbi:MAG: hypothetical protein LBR37_00980 [Erysipelotrichaceae bacterium]|nr:hypothetical protein [Erysipelotrichaceae bacterium]